MIETLPALEKLLDERSFPSKSFSIPKLKVGPQTHPSKLRNITFRYTAEASTYIYAFDDASIIDSFERLAGSLPELDIETQGGSIPNFYTSVVSKHEYSMSEDIGRTQEQVLRFCPKKTPFTAYSNGQVMSLEMYALNVPQLKFISNRLELKHDKTTITLFEINTKKEDECAGYSITHKVKITSIIEFSNSADIEKLIMLVSNFLTFVTGQFTGLGHLIGRNSHDKDVMFQPGFRRVDPPIKADGWFRFDPRVNLDKVFEGFSLISKNSGDYEILDRSLNFYRTANLVSSAAREVALISACSGVEAMSSYLLRERGGWSKSLLKKASLADKIRAATSLISLNDSITTHCTDIKSRLSKAHYDEFELLTMFRNKIVHSDQDFKYTGLELYEAFNIFQWLNEMFIFSLIGYRGGMSDRRKRTGYDETVTVPIKNESTS